MPSTSLHDRAIILVSGPEAEHFLQNILTLDVEALQPGEVKPGALLSPQGKILFDFLISRTSANSGKDAFQLECRTAISDDFHRRLLLYKLRAKVEISKPEQSVVTIFWGDDSSFSESDSSLLNDTRFKDGLVKRSYAPPPATGNEDAWHEFRIASGIAESGSDFQPGDAFPHDVLLDQTGGIGFTKGCYVGQEVVSRMQHRGTARRRVLIATASAPLPPTGTELTVDGRPVGALGSVSGKQGLAIARIDRVKKAMDAKKPILADTIEVVLSIPDWAGFSFPEDASPAGED